MNAPTNYLIATSVCLAFAYLIYLLFFRKETNFKQRRFFLIFAAVFSLLLPTGSYYILLPLTTKAETQTETFAPPPVLEIQDTQVSTPDFYSVNPVVIPDTEPVKRRSSINLLQVLQYLYFAGVAVLLLRFIVQLVTINIWYSRSRKVKQPMFTLLYHERFTTPFSFFRWIFLTDKKLPEADLDKIIAHESIHVKQRHSFDAVFFELLCIFLWFNPFVWMMRRSINLTHEFLADEGAIQSGIDSLHYQALMVNQVAEANIVSVTSHFNKSMLSHRIKMIANRRLYKKAKYKILVLAPVALVLFLFIAGVNGLDQRKVIYRDLKKDPLISKVFSKDEIKDLVELRLIADKMVVNTTGESDTKNAYQKFNELLSSEKTMEEVKRMITVSHDSLVSVVKLHPALLEIYDVSDRSDLSFSLNRNGKIMQFLQELSKQNAVYKEIVENIEIAGDISPSTISSFIKEPEKYNMESEAERLYGSIIYGFLSNRILKRGETGDIHRPSTYAYLDTELLLLRFRAYQKNPSDRNAELLYEALPESGHAGLDNTGREIFGEIGDNLGTLEKQVLKGQRNSVKVAFRMFTISDGAFTEWLQIMLGKLITKNPEMFLEELKTHLHLCRELPIYNLGPEFVDKLDERIDEYKLRINALETVSASDLADIKERCIELLEKRLAPFERIKVRDDLKSKPNITIVNKSDYSPDFIESIRNSSFRGQSILLDRNKFILENDSVSYYFPDYIPIGNDIHLSGQYRGVKIDLSFKRENQSSIDYAFQVYKGENKVTENTGTAHLSPSFWLGLEMDFDQDLRKEFKYEEFKDDGAKVSIRIGKEENGGLKAKILYGTPSEEFYIDRNNSPVLRAKNTAIKEKDNQQGTENERRNSVSEDTEVIIHDLNNYSTNFIAGLYNLPEEYKKVELRGSILILNDTIFETLPDFLGFGKTYKMEGANDNVKVQLSFAQNTNSSIDYVIQVSQNREPQKQYSGVAELQASFFLGGKTEIDDEKNEVFTTLQLVDNSNAIPLFINIGKDGLFQLRCRVENGDFKSPVLRSKNIEIPNQPPLSEHDVGDLRKMNVQTLFARLRFKQPANSMADLDEEKFITYGEIYGNDLISGIRLDVRNWLSYDDLKFLMSNLESQEPCKSMMNVFSSQRPDVESTIGGFAAMFLDYYRKNQLFHPLVAIPTTTPKMVQELKEWWENYKNENTRYFEIGDVLVKVYQQNNSDSRMGNDFLCRGKVISYKNDVPVDSLKFNDMSAVGDRYGLNFSSQPVKGMIIGTKFGDYDGRLILIDENGKIQNLRGGFFFISKDQRYIVSPWHSDLAGITIYDLTDRKVKMDEETGIYPASWYYFNGEYYISEDPSLHEIRETDQIYRLDLANGKLLKTDLKLSDIQQAKSVQFYNSEFCDCN